MALRGALRDQLAAIVDQAVHSVHPRTVHGGLAHVDLRGIVRAKDNRFDPGARAIGCKRRPGITIGWHSNLGDAELLCHRYRHGDAAGLERTRGKAPLIFDQKSVSAEAGAGSREPD